MLTTSSVGIPSDMWMPANALLKPSVMRQLALGYEYNFPDKEYTLSLEAYMRRTSHVVDYRKNADIFQNDRIEDESKPVLPEGVDWNSTCQRIKEP